MATPEAMEAALRRISQLADEHANVLDQAFRLLGDGALIGPGGNALADGLERCQQTVQASFLAAYREVHQVAVRQTRGHIGASPPRMTRPPAGRPAAVGRIRGGIPELLNDLANELSRAGWNLEHACHALTGDLSELGFDPSPGYGIGRGAEWALGTAGDLRSRRDQLLHQDGGPFDTTKLTTAGFVAVTTAREQPLSEPVGPGHRTPAPVGYFDVPPFWAPTDIRQYNVAPPTAKDNETLDTMGWLVLGGLFKQWATASYLLEHWLENSGKPVEVNPAELMKRSPQMRAMVNEWLDTHKTDVYFDTGWMNARFSETENPDLYYAFNGYQLRLHGGSYVKNGVVYQDYTIDFYKRYNFGTKEEGRRPFHARIIGSIPQEDISHLHTVGEAQDFDVFGSVTLTRPLPGVDPGSVYWPGG